MTPGEISRRVVTDRLTWIERMIQQIRELPLEDREAFFADRRNESAAESCLRRALEALLDLGRHILAKGFGKGVSAYKEIASELDNHKVFSSKEAELLRVLAGYRNRMVHFYHEIGSEELYEICAHNLADLEFVAEAYRTWLREHEEWLNETL